MDKIIAVIPAFNEQNKIGRTVQKIPRDLVSKILVIDDGSTDLTAQEARNAGAEVITQKANSGVGAAIRTGIEYALNHQYQIVVVMGGDDQDNPDEVSRLINPILHDHFVFIQGSRYLPGGQVLNQPFFRFWTTKVFSTTFSLLTGFRMTDGTNGFRAFQTSIFQNSEINLHQAWLNHYELEPYLLWKVVQLKLKIKEVPVTKRYHLAKVGYTKMKPILDWWSIIRPLIYLKLKIRH